MADIEAEIDARRDRGFIRNSGAYFRGMKLAVSRISAADDFALDRGGIEPLAFGQGKALYYDRQAGFFLCVPDINRYLAESEDGEEIPAVNVTLHFMMFAGHGDSKAAGKRQMKDALPLFDAILKDVFYKYVLRETGSQIGGAYDIALFKFDSVGAGKDPNYPEEDAPCRCRSWLTGYKTKQGEVAVNEGRFDPFDGDMVEDFMECLQGRICSKYKEWLDDWKWGRVPGMTSGKRKSRKEGMEIH
ncbi:MAG: hypothetical protein ACYCR3_10005 [Acidithiobacillus sp.]